MLLRFEGFAVQLLGTVLSQPHDLSPLSLPAGVHVVLPDAPPEEAFAAIAAGSPVMLPCGAVPADGTQRAHPDAVGSVEVGCF